MLECITDHAHSNRTFGSDGPRNLYYTGSLGSNISSSYAGSEAYRFASEKDYTAIRYAWIFIENADRIPDATPAEIAKVFSKYKLVRSGEAHGTIGVVIGGVLLAGLYTLFNTTVMPTLSSKITEMFTYSGT